MRVFRNKAFTRFARQADISDSVLCGVVAATGKGLIAASLGSSVFKQRIARPGQGKSGGFRVLLVFKAHERAIFVHGFAKKETENIGSDELTALRKLASELLALDDKGIARAVAGGVLKEVFCDEEAISRSADGLDSRNGGRSAQCRPSE